MQTLKLTYLLFLTLALGASTANAASVGIIWQLSGTATTTIFSSSIVTANIVLIPTTPLIGAGSVIELSADATAGATIRAAAQTTISGWMSLDSPTIGSSHSENVIAQGDLLGLGAVDEPIIIGTITVHAGVTGGAVTVQAGGAGDDIFAGAQSVLEEYTFNPGWIISAPTPPSLPSLGPSLPGPGVIPGGAGQAATSEQIDPMRAKALAWLYLHQDGDGFWDGPGETDVQATGLAMLAYNRAGVSAGYSRGAALTWLANAHARSVEALGFQASALGQANRDVADLLARLETQRESRFKAWGSYPGYQPSMPDTAIAIDAFILSGAPYADDGATLWWVAFAAQNPVDGDDDDGGWAYIAPSIGGSPVHGPSRVIPTAWATISVSRWEYNFNVLDDNITEAIEWLTAPGRQLADGEFSDDPNATAGEAYETALVLQAIREAQAAGNEAAGAATATMTMDAAEDFLVATQDANGGWSDDPFAAAVVVNALPAVILPDSDSDGIPDAVEAFTGTNPNVADATSLLQPIGDGVVGTHIAEHLVSAELGKAIETFLPASGEASSFFINSGVLPEGLTLEALTGRISGTPATAGTYNIEYTADLTDGSQEMRVVAIDVKAPAVPAVPGAMLVLIAMGVVFTARITRRASLYAICAIALGIGAAPRDAIAAGGIPESVSDRIVEEYAGGRTDVQTAEIREIEAALTESLRERRSPRARRMFGRSLVPKLKRYREVLFERLDETHARLLAQGKKKAAQKIASRIRALTAKMDALQRELEALDGGSSLNPSSAMARLQSRARRARASRHPKHQYRPGGTRGLGRPERSRPARPFRLTSRPVAAMLPRVCTRSRATPCCSPLRRTPRPRRQPVVIRRPISLATARMSSSPRKSSPLPSLWATRRRGSSSTSPTRSSSNPTTAPSKARRVPWRRAAAALPISLLC